MHEQRAIVTAVRSLGDEPGALATVVELMGSGYRRAGARLVAARDGRTVGGISGGCLEADALEHARQVMARGQARLVTYDTTDPGDVLLGVGLGCEGVVRVLIEPLASPGCRALVSVLEQVHQTGVGACQAVVVEVAGTPGAGVGDRLLWHGDRLVHLDPVAPALRARLEALAPTARTGLVRVRVPTGEATIFWEAIVPPPALWLCGAGLDAPALARLAASQGYRTSVFDHRPAYLQPARFGADVRLVQARPGAFPAEDAAAPPAAAMVLTHQYEADRAWLGALLPLPLAYLGLLGPRRRAERLLGELRAEGRAPAGWPAELYAPMGLDLGAETPGEIALATLAELRAVLSGRPAGFLRDRHAPIHTPAPVLRAG